MGQDLMRYWILERSFREAERFMAKLRCSWSLRKELLSSGPQCRINEPELNLPLCTTLQVGLVYLLESFGVRPDAVVGHSWAEIVAAYCSGGISDRLAVVGDELHCLPGGSRIYGRNGLLIYIRVNTYSVERM